MNLNQIVENEAAPAEALLAGYLGLYAGSVDLADIDMEYMDGVSPDLKRCVRMIQDLSEVSVVTQQVARNMVNSVDTLHVA